MCATGRGKFTEHKLVETSLEMNLVLLSWGTGEDPMLRARTLLIGSLLIVCQLGCGGAPQAAPPQAGQPQGGPYPSGPANISVSPANAVVGSADLTITITGSSGFSFANGHVRVNKVFWAANGSDTELTSTFVSTSQLTAVVPPALLVSPLQAQVHVEVWDRQEGTLYAKSNTVPFSVTAVPVAKPTISSISPEGVSAGSPDVTITIEGSNYGHFGHFIWSTVFWTTNGNLHDTGHWLQTSIISDTQLKAVIPSALLQSPTSVQIVVMNGDIMGMSDGYFGYPRSNSLTFTVTP